MAKLHKIDLLKPDERDAVVRDIVLGHRTMAKVAKDIGISDTSVGRYMTTVEPDERLEIVARSISASKMAAAQGHADLLNEFGEDVDRDLKWVLNELKELLGKAKGDEDLRMQLGTLKEVRQSLMSLAELHGRLNKKIDISLNLNESPQFIQLRQIILQVLSRHPEAKADFLTEMKVLQVIESPS